MQTHELKIWPEFFEAVATGRKPFELRKNDRDFQVGDKINLSEYSPVSLELTGRTLAGLRISYILGSEAFLQPGVVALGLDYSEAGPKRACGDMHDGGYTGYVSSCPSCRKASGLGAR